MPQQEIISGVYKNTRWRSLDDESPYIIGYLEDKTCVKGRITDGDMQPGILYEFYGEWTENDHGKAFAFKQYVVKVPHSREGIIAYLQRYCDGIGPVVAARIVDRWQHDSVRVLRMTPEIVAETPALARVGFTLEKAINASKQLEQMSFLEDVKIGLINLFHGRGFPHTLVEDCAKKWGLLAPNRIKHDPFTLLVNGMSGCGFARCDRLYCDLGLPPDRLKRQMICLWHCLNADSSGNTWRPQEDVFNQLRGLISGAKLQPKKALALGLRSRWIARHIDSEGKEWLAEGERARAERYVATRLNLLRQWTTLNDTTELRSLLAAAS